MSFGVQSASLFSSSSTSDTSTSNSLRAFANLDLTEDQRTQIRAIFKNAKTDGLTQTQIQDQINAILTPDQLTTLEDDIANAASSSSTTSTDSTQKPQGPPPGPPPGGNPFSDPNGPFANLNLTSDQQTQIAQIFSDAKSQGLSFDQINAKISAILTTAQQTTFAGDLKNLSDASTASASVSGQSQSGSDGTSASTSSGVSESDIQNQIAAATSLILKQLQYELSLAS